MVPTGTAQTAVNAAQQVTLQGLRTSAAHGSFNAAAQAADGSLYLLLDEHDGVRVLKSNATATTLLTQTQMGAAGDVGLAMAVDPSGNLYVAGTTSSGTLTGTSGAAFPSVADSSTNSFVAKYDADLNLKFLTFLGAGRTAAASVAATADGVFVTGITFNAAFPVTAAGIQQSPARGTSQNGFVERLSADGSALQYATYLTGVGGSTSPTAIVVDANDDAYVSGSTQASGFPTINALQPEILLAAGVSSSGFLTRLNPSGSAFTFSTFVAGAGVTGMALDAGTNTLLLTGSIALGQFPVATVAMPLAATGYQTLVRVSEDGQSVTESVLLTAGTSSSVTPGASGDAWVSGAVGVPLFSGLTPPDYASGDSFLLHVAAGGSVNQTLRFGGTVKNNASYASLSSTVGAPVVAPNAAGTTVTLPGSITASLSASLLGTQTFELPLLNAPNTVLPNVPGDSLPTASSCGTSSVCTGSGALLAQALFPASAGTTTSLGVSANDLPNVTVRNLGSVTASGVAVSASGYSVTTDCGASLAASSQCSVALTGGGPGTLTVSASNASAQTVALATNALQPDALVLSADELDFGIVSAASGTAIESITVTNLSSTSQTFTSAKDGGVNTTAYTLAEAGSNCAAGGAVGAHLLAAGASCHITLGLTASSVSANDGAVRAAWKIGMRDIAVTGFAQAAALSVSATEVDFGTLIAGGVRLPRYLYLSNDSTNAVAHALAALPVSSSFALNDDCPSVLEPQSVCQLVLGYQPASATATDSATLTLDAGISVLLTGNALPAASVTGATANPSLNLSTTAVSFATPVDVTEVSGTTQAVTLKNTGTSGFALVFTITGDFTLSNGCPAVLNAAASCTVLLGFAPSQPGMRQGLLSVTAGSGFAPSYVALSGTGTAIMPANNGVLSIGQTLVGEPVVAWYKVQQPLASLTAAASGAGFGVALVADTGSGHGTLPASSFTQSATAACTNCWLGVQFLSQTAGSESGLLTLTNAAGGNPYGLTLTASALAVQGLVLAPLTQDFGPVMLGSTSGAMVFTLSDVLSPAALVTVQSVSATGDFAVSANTTGGASCSGTLAATASCFVEVAFSPTSAGDRAGTLTIVTSGGTVTAALTGYGSASTGVTITPTALTFANVPGSTATMQTVTIANNGSASVAVGEMTTTDPSFVVSSNCATLAASAMCSATLTFTPQTSTVAATLAIPVTETVNGQTVSAVYSVALSGAYTTQSAGLEIVADEVDYGASATGSLVGARQFTLNNLSGKALNITLDMPREFPLAASAPCATLAAGGSCSFSVGFAPVEAGALTGTVLAQGTSTDGLTNVAALAYMLGYGEGAGSLTVSGNAIPYSPVSFGQLTSGKTAQQSLTLTNSGSGTLTVRRLSSAPPFLTTSNCGAALAAGASCSVTVSYAPVYEVSSGASAGTRSDTGTLSIESDAASSPSFLALSGLALPVTSSSPASGQVLATYALSNSALTFTNTQVGNASNAQTVTLTNTGTTTVHVLGMIAPVDFTVSSTCATLLPGAMCSVSVTFTPGTASMAALRVGTLEIQTDATDSLEYVSLVGSSTAAPLTLSAASLNFGSVNVGMSSTLSVSVTNNAAAPVTFTGLSAGGAYSTTAGTCPAVGSTLAAGSTCSFQVTFAPTATGTQTATASLSTDATQLALTVALTGTGTAAQLQVAASALAFGSIAVGASSSLTLTLTNTGSATLTGLSNALSGTNAVDFLVTVPCNVTTLAQGQGCVETVTFMPDATGARAATLTIASSDPNGPATVALSGMGVAAAASFTLSVSPGTVTVNSGSPASYALTLMPLNGYTGSVALTCAPMVAAKYASCSLLAPLLTLNGTAAQATAATISTVSAIAAVRRNSAIQWAWLLLVPLAWLHRRNLRARMRWLLLAVLISACVGTVACGGKSPSGSATANGGNTVTTPAGTYQYQVTASSTNGTVISSTVTLNLIVQ